MQPLQIKNILLLLSLCPIQISRPRRPYPRHWKSNQQIPLQPQTLGEEIKKHRLELHWLQTDVAAKIGISNTSSECCLFEKFCNSFTENKLKSQVHATVASAGFSVIKPLRRAFFRFTGLKPRKLFSIISSTDTSKLSSWSKSTSGPENFSDRL